RGTVIYERPSYDPVRVYPQRLARDMNGMLARVVLAGTGNKAAVNRWTVAGKTGTSQDWRDAWFVGFASDLIGGVWVGNDDDSPMAGVSGGGLPAELWSDLMGLALADNRPTRLAGAEGYVPPSEAAEQRIAFYRGLANAFGTIERRTLVTADRAGASQR
ncbi:MAG: penicillin-binding transpeptidase domain-containing protein, partial [Pseudomonadota bacterium]